MDNNLLKILKELKEIQPDADYSHRSKIILLSEIKANKRQINAEKTLPKLKFADILNNFYSSKLVLGLTTAVILLLMVSGGVYYYVKNQSNQSDLLARASEANASIQVKLNEIQYLIKNQNQLNTSQIVAVKALLQRAADDLKAAVSSDSRDLNQSLEKIKTVQEMLYQLNMSTNK